MAGDPVAAAAAAISESPYGSNYDLWSIIPEEIAKLAVAAARPLIEAELLAQFGVMAARYGAVYPAPPDAGCEHWTVRRFADVLAALR